MVWQRRDLSAPVAAACNIRLFAEQQYHTYIVSITSIVVIDCDEEGSHRRHALGKIYGWSCNRGRSHNNTGLEGRRRTMPDVASFS